MEKDFRKWFRRQIGKRGETIAQFVARSGIPRPTINEWLRYSAPSIRPDKVKKLAESLGFEYEDVERILAECEDAAAETVGRIVPPLFDRNLAAGLWTEAIPVGEDAVSATQLQLDLFNVRISGDSMESKWPDGSTVEFRVVRVADDGLEIGGDFYIQRDDDMATFKRIKAMNDEIVLLEAVNKEKYPKPMRIERIRIVRAARAIRILK